MVIEARRDRVEARCRGNLPHLQLHKSQTFHAIQTFSWPDSMQENYSKDDMVTFELYEAGNLTCSSTRFL